MKTKLKTATTTLSLAEAGWIVKTTPVTIGRWCRRYPNLASRDENGQLRVDPRALLVLVEDRLLPLEGAQRELAAMIARAVEG